VRLTLRLFAVTALACAVLAPAAHAQRQQSSMLVELGIDASFARQSFHSEPNRNGQEITTNVNTIDIPLGVIRAGFFLTPNIALEPAFGLHYQHVGDVSTSSTVFDIGLPIYLTGTRRENQIFIRPVVGLDYISSDVSDVEGNGSSDTQVNVGVGLGIKMPLSDRFAARFEAQYRHAPKSGARSAYDQIAALAGISVYVR
jgi:outer membrane protein W